MNPYSETDQTSGARPCANDTAMISAHNRSESPGAQQVLTESPRPSSYRSAGSVLKVLHVIDSISPLRGGPSQSLWHTLRASAVRGIKVAVITTNDDGPGRTVNVPMDRFVKVNGFEVRYFPRQTNFYTASWPMWQWLLAHVREYDLVHVHALFSFAPTVASYSARFRGVPYVISPHGVLGVWGLENRRPRLKRASIQWVEGPLLRRARCVQFCSRREQDEFSQLGVHANTSVIPHAMPAEPGDVAISTFKPPAELAALAGRPAILFLARIHPIKGLELLLRAFAGVIQQHPNVVLLVAGNGEASFVAGLQKLALNLGISNHIRWIGFVSGTFKRWLFERASVFVQPSWSENFGIAVAEAMAIGVPVIVTNGVGIADIVAKNHCGLVTESTIPSLQQAINDLLKDDVTRLRMGAAGRHAVREQLSLDVYSSRLESMYRHACNPSATDPQPLA